MRQPRIILCLSITANIALAACVWFLLDCLRAARTESSNAIRELHQQVKELEGAAKPRPAPQPALSDAEVLELARLRNEVTRLRNEQRTAAPTNSPAARRPATPVPTPATTRPATKLTSAVTAQVPLGHALALGGWLGSEPGQRVVGFITPATVTDSPGAVLLETRLVSLPDRLLDRLGLQDLRTDQPGSQSAAGLDPARLAALLKLAEQETGVSILSSPRVITANGQPATVSVTQTQPDGTQTGPIIKLLPTLDATGNSVRLDVGLELNLPARP